MSLLAGIVAYIISYAVLNNFMWWWIAAILALIPAGFVAGWVERRSRA